MADDLSHRNHSVSTHIS